MISDASLEARSAMARRGAARTPTSCALLLEIESLAPARGPAADGDGGRDDDERRRGRGRAAADGAIPRAEPAGGERQWRRQRRRQRRPARRVRTPCLAPPQLAPPHPNTAAAAADIAAAPHRCHHAYRAQCAPRRGGPRAANRLA